MIILKQVKGKGPEKMYAGLNCPQSVQIGELL
jgi:hypothetical protein